MSHLLSFFACFSSFVFLFFLWTTWLGQIGRSRSGLNRSGLSRSDLFRPIWPKAVCPNSVAAVGSQSGAGFRRKQFVSPEFLRKPLHVQQEKILPLTGSEWLLASIQQGRLGSDQPQKSCQGRTWIRFLAPALRLLLLGLRGRFIV